MTDAIDDKPDNIEPAADAPATEVAAPANTASPDVVPYQDPPLEELLAQYDEGVQSRQQPAQPQQPVDPLAAFQQQQQASDIATRERALARHVQQRMQADYVRSEQQAFVKFAAEGQAALADLKHLPPSYVEDRLISRAVQNPDLRVMWDNRNSARLSASQRAMINGRLRAELNRVVDEARRLPDPDISADYSAVAAAVRSAGGRGEHHHEPPPDYGNMREGEFRRHVLEKHGFDPMR
jgi:hypothetical protein